MGRKFGLPEFRRACESAVGLTPERGWMLWAGAGAAIAVLAIIVLIAVLGTSTKPEVDPKQRSRDIRFSQRTPDVRAGQSVCPASS